MLETKELKINRQQNTITINGEAIEIIDQYI